MLSGLKFSCKYCDENSKFEFFISKNKSNGYIRIINLNDDSPTLFIEKQ